MKKRVPKGLLKYRYKDRLKKDIQFQAKNYGDQRQHTMVLGGEVGRRQWSVYVDQGGPVSKEEADMKGPMGPGLLCSEAWVLLILGRG